MMNDHDWCEAARKRNTMGGMYNDAMMQHIRNPEEQTLNFQHIIPLNDLKPHISERFCECMPVADAENPAVIIHPAYDGRELRERYRQLGYR
jgi:hypothetical protein